MAPADEVPPERGRGGRAPDPEGHADASGAGVAGPERDDLTTALTIFGLVLVGLVAIALIPRALYSPAPTSPPVGLVLGVGVGVTAISAAAIYGVLAFRKSFWSRVVIITVMYAAVIAFVGFVLAPEALHHLTLKQALTRTQLTTAIVLTALASLLLYALVSLVIYRRGMTRVLKALGGSVNPQASLIGLFLFLGSVAILAVLAFAFFSAGDVPLAMVGLGGIFGLAIVVGVVASAIIEVSAFRAAENQATTIRNAAVLAGLLFVALAILAGYHVAWVIYVLWLSSTWPLKAPSGC